MITTKMPKIKVHFSIILYFIICLYTGFLKDFLLILSILLFHELGHIIWIITFKGKIKKISFSLIGGLMDIEVPSLKLLPNALILCGRPS